MRFSRRRTALLLVTLSLFLAACGSDGDDPEPAAPTVADSTVTTLPTTTTVATVQGVVLDEPGAQPRQPLVLKVARGSRMRAAMVNKIGLELTLDGRALPAGVTPTTRTVLEQRGEAVDADGTVHFTMTFADVSVIATPGVDPAVARQVQAGLDQLEGLQGTGAVHAQNDVKSFSVDSSRITDATLKSTLDSMSDQVGNLSSPFPKEPVGVGARWTVRRSATINGLTMNMMTRYTLESRTGDRYELDVTQNAVSPPGPAAFPNLPAGSRASVVNFTLQSKGTVTGDVTRSLPVNSTMSGTGDGAFAITAGNDGGTLQQKMTIDLSMSPA